MERVVRDQDRVENALFVRRKGDKLLKIHGALKFSGRAFIAKGLCQFFFESCIVTSLDEFAFGVFLLDAAHTIKKLASNAASCEPAADELCASLESIGDTHSIFAWVTSYEVFMIISTFFGLPRILKTLLLKSEVYGTLSAFAEDHPFLVVFLKVVIAALGLRFGGWKYARTKLSYWTRASSLAAYLLSDKIIRSIGRRPRRVHKDTAKVL